MSDPAKQSGSNRWVAIVSAVVVAAATALAFAAMSNPNHARSDGSGYTRTMHQGPNPTRGWLDQSRGGMSMGHISITSESDYLAEMVVHHQEAVDAAGELTRSDRADMRNFGAAIVRTQSAQIRQMKSWLHDWYPDQPTTTYRPMMRDLSALSGDDLDRAFLRDMIGHHMVAVMMSQHLLFSGTDHDDVARLAESIRDDQHTEIIQMQRWLSEWFDEYWRIGSAMMRGFRS